MATGGSDPVTIRAHISSFLRRFAYSLVGLAIAVLAIFVGWRLGQPQINEFLTTDSLRGEFLILFSVSGIFVFSAIAYQLQYRETRLNNVQREFALLGLLTEEEAKKRYDRKYSPINYLLFVILAVYVTILGLSLFLWPPSEVLILGVFNSWVFDDEGTRLLFDRNTLSAMQYGFLGALVFATTLVYRRYRQTDLQPTVYLNCALVLMAGLIFNFVAFEMVRNVSQNTGNSAAAGAEAGILAIVAFSLGYFPYLAVRWFQQISYSVLNMRQRRAVALPLGLIDGISQLHEVRLRDEGIDNIQNLASAPLADLLINTSFGAEQMIEWIDQASLYVYLEPSEIDSFRRAGIRTLSDFHDAWESCQMSELADAEADDVRKSRESRESRAKEFQTTPERLDTLYQSTKTGPNVHHVRNYWEEARRRSTNIREEEGKSYREMTTLIGSEGDTSLRKELISIASPFERYSDLWHDDSSETSYSVTGEALIAQQNSEFERAEERYLRAIELDNDNTNYGARNNLAYLYAEELHRRDKGKLLAALGYAQAAVNSTTDEKTDFATYLDTLATVKIRLAAVETDVRKKRTYLDEAKAHLEKATKQPHDLRTDANRAAVAKHLQEANSSYADLPASVETGADGTRHTEMAETASEPDGQRNGA